MHSLIHGQIDGWMDSWLFFNEKDGKVKGGALNRKGLWSGWLAGWLTGWASGQVSVSGQVCVGVRMWPYGGLWG